MSYPSNRWQYVQIDGEIFASSNITCIVPQGSILDRLLFILYTNDFNSCTKFLNAIILLETVKDKYLSGLVVKSDTELRKDIKWLQINRLSLNVSK